VPYNTIKMFLACAERLMVSQINLLYRTMTEKVL